MIEQTLELDLTTELDDPVHRYSEKLRRVEPWRVSEKAPEMTA